MRQLFQNSEYIFPVRASEQEPLPEEMEGILAAIEPMLSSGHSSHHSVGMAIASHAGSFGMRPESLAPVYYMAGLNEVQIRDRTVLLQFPERTAVPLICETTFPISFGAQHEFSRITGPSPTWLNRLFFMAYDSLIFDVCPFSSIEDLAPIAAEGSGRRIHISEAYTGPSVTSGWFTEVGTTVMRYTGCCRLPTLEEVDAWFARIPVGIVLNFPFGVADVFNQYGMRSRDYEEARYRGAAPQPSAEVTTPRAGINTNVPAQDFSGERPRAPQRRNPSPRSRPGTRIDESLIRPAVARNTAWTDNDLNSGGIVFEPSSEPPPSFISSRVTGYQNLRFTAAQTIPQPSQPPI